MTKRAILVLTTFFLSPCAYAQTLDYSTAEMSYREVTTWHEQHLVGTPTRAQRLEALREIVRGTSAGETRLRRVFGNFEGNRSIDPTIPGVEQSVRLLRSGSSSQVKGYQRELLYATAIHNDSRYRVEAMNRRLTRRWGNTDADIVFQHLATGQYGRIEVKEVTLSSQRTNVRNYARQMDKMALEARHSGQPQFWINRHAVTPELKQYASSKGIVVLEKVATGKRRPANTMGIEEAMDRADQKFVRTTRLRITAGAAQLGFGSVLTARSVPLVWLALDDLSHDSDAWLRLGEHASYTIAGTGMVLSGSALLASRYVPEISQSRLHRISRAGTGLSVIALASGQAFLIARYAAGDVSTREFWTEQWQMSGSAAGALAGGLLGKTAGALIGGNPVLASAGGALGGMAGGWIGNVVSAWGVDRFYDVRFGELDEAFGREVYRQYGVH